MDWPDARWAVALTLAIVLAHELLHGRRLRRAPQRLARGANAMLRAQWFAAVSAQPASEVLAVQTLRNAMMSATVVASAAVLGLMGTVTLAAPGLAHRAAAVGPWVDAQLLLALGLLGLLFSALVASAMALRHYQHASFVVGMPVGSPERAHWAESGLGHLRRAGLAYSWALRHLLLIAPVLAALLHPWAGPPAALSIAWLLTRLDRTPAA